jgi:hypothetical protein
MKGSFKLNGTVNDVQSKGVDKSSTETEPKSAKNILHSSGLQYEVTLQHAASWEKTLVRIQCKDSTWSNWITVQK